jgi:hypothetical protein
MKRKRFMSGVPGSVHIRFSRVFAQRRFVGYMGMVIGTDRMAVPSKVIYGIEKIL